VSSRANGAKGIRPTACEHTDRIHYAHGLCEACDRRRRRHADPDFYRRESERQKARMLNTGKTEADRHREWYFRAKYGITHAEYDVMLAEQAGRCAICSGPPTGPGQRLHVDHCHTTGTVRGLLCGNCNTAIGLMADDPERLLSAAAYLTRDSLDHARKDSA